MFLISHMLKKWKQTRLMIFNMLYDELSTKEISRKLKISDKAVYKNINAGELSTIIKIVKEISNSINELIKKKNNAIWRFAQCSNVVASVLWI